MIDRLESPNINKNMIAIVVITMNCEEFVNEISILPILISANFDIANWCIGSIKFGSFADAIA